MRRPRWCRREEHGEQGEQACDCGSTGMTGATRRSPGVVVVEVVVVVGDGYSGGIAMKSGKTVWWKPSQPANDANWRPSCSLFNRSEEIESVGVEEDNETKLSDGAGIG
jgi:hypothetical protein